MNDKFELYDILAVLIPGSIVLGLVCVTFPALVSRFSTARFPEAFAIICLIALAVVVGHLIQAIGSIFEPFLYWTWGGHPSERALQKGLGDRYLPLDTAQRIRAKLAGVVGARASDRSLFLYAMQKAETSGNSRVAKFNGLFAYHRAVLMLITIGLGVLLSSMKWGALRQWPLSEKLEIVLAGAVILIVIWFRAKQRGFYYVREVISTAERIIDTESEKVGS